MNMNAMNSLQRFLGLFDPEDSPSATVRKTSVLGTSSVILVCCAVSCLHESASKMRYMYLIPVGVGLVFLVTLLVTRRASSAFMSCYLISLALSAIVFDWAFAALAEHRIWPCIMLLLDMNLLASGPEWVSLVMLGMTLVWILISSIEDAYGLGMYDPFSDFGWGATVRICDCDDPPCPKGGLVDLFSTFGTLGSVVVMDFLLTRHFATSLNAASARMELSIDIAQKVAHALSEFDLDAASSQLDSETHLPDGLRDALEQILKNLTCYRPYIPEAILSSGPSHSETNVVDAPGLYTGAAALVFTDIKSSTATWDAEPAAMKQALRIHNKVLRATIAQFDGYEVKTVGDSFMVAFESFDAAVRFGLAAQVSLYEQEWPAELMKLPQCASVAGVWNGLRIRVGVHCGEVEVEKNAVNDRFDYHGTTVNKAARLEGVCPPGGVAIDSKAAEGGTYQFVKEAVMASRDVIKLRGLGETAMQILFPRPLFGRQPNNVAEFGSASKRSSKSMPRHNSRILDGTLPTSHWNETKRFAMSTSGVAALHDSEEGDSVVGAVTQLHDSLAWIQNCLDRSDGSMVTVTGSFAVFAWNVVQACASHAENACRFASLLEQDNRALVCGLCCSKHALVVLAGRQKYVTLIGYGSKVAERVCRRAIKVKCPALYALPLTDNALPSSLTSMLVQLETWELRNSLESVLSFVVYMLEVDVAEKSASVVLPLTDAYS
ncbi:Adenylate cyclase [Diplonema papillatum]|nr:Adenylate cyclase [Diplonema papillatum]